MSTAERFPYVHVGLSGAEVEIASAELWALGATGVEQRDGSTLLGPDRPQDDVTLVASFGDEASARAAQQALAARWPARVEFVVGDEWREGWRAYFKPLRIGERFVVRPSWERGDIRAGDIELVVDPENAFGTGQHATTRLCLVELERRLTAGARVLDVGCGSGILAIAAARLGAREVCAIDVDPDAVEVTRRNARDNGAPRVRASTSALDDIDGRFELVLANIEASVLVSLASPLLRRLAPAGTLVLSGIIRERREEVLAAYAPLALLGEQHDEGWVALSLGSDARG